eukprot:386964_1
MARSQALDLLNDMIERFEISEPRLKSTIYLMRHAEKSGFYLTGKWNAALGCPKDRAWDCPITEMGKYQAHQAALNLKNKHNTIKRIICSPFIRCVETALEIEKCLHIPISIDYCLCEELRKQWFQWSSFSKIYLKHSDLSKKYQYKFGLHSICATPTNYEINGEYRSEIISKTLTKEYLMYHQTLFITHGGICNHVVSKLTSVYPGPVKYCSCAQIQIDGHIATLIQPFTIPSQ